MVKSKGSYDERLQQAIQFVLDRINDGTFASEFGGVKRRLTSHAASEGMFGVSVSTLEYHLRKIDEYSSLDPHRVRRKMKPVVHGVLSGGKRKTFYSKELKDSVSSVVLGGSDRYHTAESIADRFGLRERDAVGVLNQLTREGRIARLHWGHGTAFSHPGFVRENQIKLSEYLSKERFFRGKDSRNAHSILLTALKNPFEKFGAGELARKSGLKTQVGSESVRSLAKAKNPPLVRVGASDFQLAEHLRPK